MKTYTNILLAIIISTVSLMPLAACSPTVSREDAEKELISFWLDFTIQQGLSQNSYTRTSGEPWVNPPSSANIIIFLPPYATTTNDPWEQLALNSPIKVWWYFDNKLVEATDNQIAIAKWKEYYSPDDSNNWPMRYEFGILSISKNNKKATIYESSSTCPICAGGMLYTLKRNNSGEWEITDSELLWLS